MQVTRIYLTGRPETRDLPITSPQLHAIGRGTPASRAAPNLSLQDQAFLDKGLPVPVHCDSRSSMQELLQPH